MQYSFTSLFKDLSLVKNDLVKYFRQHVRNGLIIHLKKSLKDDIC